VLDGSPFRAERQRRRWTWDPAALDALPTSDQPETLFAAANHLKLGPDGLQPGVQLRQADRRRSDVRNAPTLDRLK
jgi:hypothetical protein